MIQMKITFIGSSHGVPEPNRKCTCIMIEVGANVYFIDMGAPAIDELRTRGISIDAVKGVFITHMHGDHTDGLIQFIDLGFNQNFHNSSITFGKKKFSRGDRFPLLYASENYAPNEYYKVIVYRVMETGDQNAPYSLEVVQTINMPDPHENEILYPHCFYDRDGNCFWIEAYSLDKKENVYTRYKLPRFKAGSTVDMGKPLRTFRLPRDPKTDQAIYKRGDRMYQVVGARKTGKLRVIDVNEGTLLKVINLNDMGLIHEPEAVFFHKDDLYITFFEKGQTAIYKIAPAVYR